MIFLFCWHQQSSCLKSSCLRFGHAQVVRELCGKGADARAVNKVRDLVNLFMNVTFNIFGKMAEIKSIRTTEVITSVT